MAAGALLSCADASLAVGEPLPGSALGGIRSWLVLEHYGPWAPDAIESPDLPDAVRDHLKGSLAALPGSRFQLVRRDEGAPDGLLRLFALDTAGHVPRMLEWGLRDVADVAKIDLAAALRAGVHPDAVVRTAPLFLVCTHGRRDRCCALHGVPLARALSAVAPGEVFQVSHVGGHRFAPNVLVFPEGVCYGRLGLDEAASLVSAHRRGQLHDLGRLRGRMSLPPLVQAAEVFLRQRLGALDAAAPRVVEVAATEDGASVVSLELDGGVHAVRVRPLPPGPPRPASCGEAPTPSTGFELL